MGIADELIAYLGGLTVSQGDHEGEAFVVLAWERRFIRGTWSVDGDVALSLARGNGKTGLVGGIAAAGVDPDGPLVRRRGEIVCVASSFDQSRLIFEDVLHYLRERHDLDDRRVWRVQDSANRASIEFRANGARVRCIGSDPAKAHGLRPSLVLADEPAQWDHAKAERMLAALRTSMGKIKGSRLVALGTRPALSGHWFSRLLKSADYAQNHAAGKDDPIFQRRTWRKANPSLDHFPTLETRIRKEADESRRDASLLPSFKGLRLNLGVHDTEQSELIEAGTWARAEAGGEVESDGGYTLGIDLGGGAAMSAAAGYWPASGRLEALALFPSIPTLAERGLRDGVGALYSKIHARGELLIVKGYVAPPEALLDAVLERWGRPVSIAADRWKERELLQALAAVTFPPAAVAWRGQGFKDGGADVAVFRREVLAGRVRPGRSLLLRAALEVATTVSDPAGNEKLAKGTQGGRRSRARDDAAAAMILAIAEGSRRGRTRPLGWRSAGTAG